MTGFGEESTLAGDQSLDGLAAEARRVGMLSALFSSSKLRRFGRYVVLDVLGHGGMGVVLKGYDEQLERQVAIKVLHEDLGDKHTARLRREAQAMAKLSHPNVVQVYEVGDFDGQTFVAMELVKGQTLQAWMEQQPRPGWRACVELFVQLGEGLAAAHQQGLVHRDFKPGNAMVGEDERARVLDFGLVRQGGEQDTEPESAWAQSDMPQGSGRDQSLTRTGAVLGTPAYMPREQMFGGEVDARSDQFSFCVALYEAVYGERPYQGESLLELMDSMNSGVVRAVPKRTDVPAALRRVLLRGLDHEPDERWPSMDALLVELRVMVEPKRRRWWMWGGLVAVLGLGGSWVLGQYVQVKDRCSGAADKLASVWDDERRQEVETAILSTGLSYAPSVWDRVEPGLEEYAEGWEHKHVEVCEATTVRGEQSSEVMDLRMGCLEDRRSELKAAVGVLAHADATVVENAVALVAGLPRLTRCDDMNALRAEVPPPEDPEVAEEVESLRARLVELRAEMNAGRYASALGGIEPVAGRAEELNYAPLVAEAKQLRGTIRAYWIEYDSAEQDLRGAYELATEHRHDRVALSSVRMLAYVVGIRQARYVEAQVWGEVALSLARRSRDDLKLAESLSILGGLLESQGRYEQAEHHYERALRISEEELGVDHLFVSKELERLSSVFEKQGQYAQAQQYQERALLIGERELGTEHPSVARSRINLGTRLFAQGKYAQAERHYERALRTQEEVLGVDHPDIATNLSNLGAVFGAQGKYEQAKSYFERALQIHEAVLGAEHPDVSLSLGNLGNVYLAQEEHEQAKQYFERSLQIQQSVLGHDHPSVGQSQLNLAEVGLAQEDFDAAVVHAERAVSILEKAEVSPTALALARFVLARSLWSDRAERSRARDLAQRARDVFAEYGAERKDELVKVERWLAERP